MIDPQKLHALIDGELSPTEKAQVEAELASCTASQREVESIKSLKNLLSSKTTSESSEDAWKACQSRLDAIDRVEKSGNFVSRFSWALVGAVALIVVIGGTLSRNAQRGTVSNDMIAGIVSSSKKPMLGGYDQGLLDQRLKEADINLSRWQLLGGRKVIFDGHEVLELALADASGPMTMLVMDDVMNFENMEKSSDNRFMLGQVSTKQNCITWKSNNKSFILVGQRQHSELIRIVLNNSR